MQYSSALALLAGSALAAAGAAPTPEQNAELVVLMNDVNNKFSDYTSWFLGSGRDIPDGIVDVYMAVHTATDESYTTMFTGVDVPALIEMATAVPWYSSYLSSEIAAAIASVDATAAPATSAASVDATSAPATSAAATDATSAPASSAPATSAATSAPVTSAPVTSIETATAYSNSTSTVTVCDEACESRKAQQTESVTVTNVATDYTTTCDESSTSTTVTKSAASSAKTVVPSSTTVKVQVQSSASATKTVAIQSANGAMKQTTGVVAMLGAAIMLLL